MTDTKPYPLVSTPRCPTCQCNWSLNPPAQCASENAFRCINCKAIYTGAMLAATELLATAEMLEDAEDKRQHCEECEGEGEPEACGVCFPFFDDARITRRLAIAKAKGAKQPAGEQT